MWFQPLPAVLFGLVIFATLADAARHVAVAFTDVKFDDKGALWSLLLDPRYDKVVAIMSGINERGKASLELDRYAFRQNRVPNVNRFNPNKLTILEGGNALGERAPHEEWWKNQREMEVPQADDATLQRLLRGSKVNIFQIAPTETQQVIDVIWAAAPGSIETYMLLHGYNSKQARLDDQMYVLHNLQSWVKGRNPNAQVIFTSSFDTYQGKNGGKQPYTELKRLFPEHDLEQALRDPFWADQLLKGHNEKEVSIPRFESGLTREQLDEVIYQARTDPENNGPWRRYIAGHVKAAVDANGRGAADRNVRLGRFAYTLYPEFTGPTTLELADASHIAAVHRHLDGGQTGMRLEPIQFIRPQSENGKVAMQPATRDAFHGFLLKGADRDEDLNYIKRLAGVH